MNTTDIIQSSKMKYKKRDIKNDSIYSRCLITRNIELPITSIGKNLKDTIEKRIISMVESKCIVEGFVKNGTIKILTFSSGLIKTSNVVFEVLFECFVCFPVEGMLINCKTINITKAGIRGESFDETPSPIVVFIARDHHYNSHYFNKIQEGDRFVARVIGQRFELNDSYISIIAELVIDKDKFNHDNIKKQRLNINN